MSAPPDERTTIVNTAEGSVPQKTVPPVPKAQQDTNPWRTFFSLTGGSLLYCLSALSIVFGIAKILGPLLSQTDIFFDALPCLGAINFYELALLAVLVFVVVREKVTDDAISLVVIAALFLIGSGLTLSTVANSSPGAALTVGLLCLALAGGKLYVLKRHIGMPIERGVMAGLAIVLAWNFLSGSVLTGITSDGVTRNDWLTNWLILLIGAAVIYVFAKVPYGQPKEKETPPFLRSESMPLLFALILLGAALVHQYVLGYIFEFKWCEGDYLPLASVGALIGLKLSLSLYRKVTSFAVVLALAPLGACLLCILESSILCGASFGVSLIWYPPVMLALIGTALVPIYRHTRSQFLLPVLGIYLLGVLFTWGYDPGAIDSLNWRALGGITVIALLVIGLLKRNAWVCFVAMILLTGGLAGGKCMSAARDLMQLSYPGSILGLAGLSTIALAFVFGKKTPQVLIFIGSLGIMFAAFDAYTAAPSFADAAIIGFLLFFGVAVYRKTGTWLGPVTMLVPVTYRLWAVFNLLAGWRYVILSFVLLFVGAWVSARKGHAQKKAEKNR